VWLIFCFVAFCCFRPRGAAAATVDCDDPPDQLREPERYKRWERECEERKRRPNFSLAFSDADITRYHTVAS
jgi:hypothetical protein